MYLIDQVFKRSHTNQSNNKTALAVTGLFRSTQIHAQGRRKTVLISQITRLVPQLLIFSRPETVRVKVMRVVLTTTANLAPHTS